MRIARRSDRRRETGVALLIAIFVLLLISVVAIALLVSSGTETALGANYRASSTVYYAALAGLEEARGRLLPKNPDYFNAATVPTPFPLGQPVYMINRLQGETVAPWDSGNPYYDKEYANEFGTQASAVTYQPATSVWDNNAKGIPGPTYKWVRITAATEQSLNLDVDSNGTLDHTIPIYYNPAAVDSHGNPAPGLMLGSGPPSAVQVLQITALAALPNGTQKLLQYAVYPTSQPLSFPAALTFDGPNVGQNPFDPSISMPTTGGFFINGYDLNYYPNGNTCTAGSNPSPNPLRAIGYSNNDVGDVSQLNIYNAIYNGTGENNGDFVGLGTPPPPVHNPNLYYVGSSPPPSPPGPSLAANFQGIAQISALVTNISQQADVTLGGGFGTTVPQSDATNVLPAAMSATNPMTVVVNGDFTENGWSGTGYGLLLVTGKLTYDPNSSWNGVILIIGKGVFYSPPTSGSGQINGAVLLATTVDASGNPLSSLGSPTFDFDRSEVSRGIYYSSCWVQAAQTASKYQVLSFHEIPQN
jgi:hypothetical protein